MKITGKFVRGGDTAVYSVPAKNQPDEKTVIKIPAYKHYKLESLEISYVYKTTKNDFLHRATAMLYIPERSVCQQPDCSEVIWWNENKFHNEDEVTFPSNLTINLSFNENNTIFIRAL